MPISFKDLTSGGGEQYPIGATEIVSREYTSIKNYSKTLSPGKYIVNLNYVDVGTPTVTANGFTLSSFPGFTNSSNQNYNLLISNIPTGSIYRSFQQFSQGIVTTNKEVKYINDKYFMMGGDANGAKLAISENGTSWSQVSLPSEANTAGRYVSSIDWTGTFYAITIRNSSAVTHTATSADLSSWTVAPPPSSSGWTAGSSMLYKNGVFVIVLGGTGGGKAFSSTNAINWTERYTSSTTLWDSGANFTVVAVVGSYFYINHVKSNWGNTASCIYSSDGINWSSNTVTGFGMSGTPTNVWGSDNKFLYQRYDTATGTATCYVSPTFSPSGNTWTTKTVSIGGFSQSTTKCFWFDKDAGAFIFFPPSYSNQGYMWYLFNLSDNFSNSGVTFVNTSNARSFAGATNGKVYTTTDEASSGSTNTNALVTIYGCDF